MVSGPDWHTQPSKPACCTASSTFFCTIAAYSAAPRLSTLRPMSPFVLGATDRPLVRSLVPPIRYRIIVTAAR